jgi:hypothetical protein
MLKFHSEQIWSAASQAYEFWQLNNKIGNSTKRMSLYARWLLLSPIGTYLNYTQLLSLARLASAEMSCFSWSSVWTAPHENGR